MSVRRLALGVAVSGVLALLAACEDAQEARRVDVPVFTDAEPFASVTTALGYEVTLETMRLAGADVVFAAAGEVHGAIPNERPSTARRALGWLVPAAWAHPGHTQGGDVTGEMPGRALLSWGAGGTTEVGLATLIAGRYESAELALVRGTSEDGLAPDDPLVGHTIALTGTATRDGETYPFAAVIDAPDDRRLVGVPFEAEIIEASALGRIVVKFLPRDPHEDDTPFDAVDFASLDRDPDGTARISAAASGDAAEQAHDTLRRALLSHDHYLLALEDAP
jgi:hypothetical protein